MFLLGLPKSHYVPGLQQADKTSLLVDLRQDLDVGQTGTLYSDVKNYACMFEISRLSAAGQLGQPMHSQSANFGKSKLNSRNLAGIISHHSVVCTMRRQLRCHGRRSRHRMMIGHCALISGRRRSQFMDTC